MRLNRTTTGSPRCRPTSRSNAWSIRPRCAGRIERDYLELKQEVGLGHYEGRGWRGFHHHATLCIAAYGFLISEKVELFPPQGHPRTWRGTKSSPSHRSSTQRISRCVRNATCRTQSQPCVSASRGLWRTHCRDVLAADRCVRSPSCRMSDAVGLVAARKSSPSTLTVALPQPPRVTKIGM